MSSRSASGIGLKSRLRAGRIAALLLYVATAGGAWTYHQLALSDARLITAETVAQDLAEQQRIDRLFAAL